MSSTMKLRRRQLAKIMVMVLTMTFAFVSVPSIAAGEGWQGQDANGPFVFSPAEDFTMDDDGVITNYIGARPNGEDMEEPEIPDKTAIATEDTEEYTAEATEDTEDTEVTTAVIATEDTEEYTAESPEEATTEDVSQLPTGDKVVVVPAKIGDEDVVGLDGAFVNDTTVETILIPDTITFIGYKTFKGCTSLKTVAVYSTTDYKTLEEINGDQALNIKNYVKVSGTVISTEVTEATEATEEPEVTEATEATEATETSETSEDTTEATEIQAPATNDLYYTVIGNVSGCATIPASLEELGYGVFAQTSISYFSVMEGNTIFKHDGAVDGNIHAEAGTIGGCLLSADGTKLYSWAPAGPGNAPTVKVTSKVPDQEAIAKYIKEKKVSEASSEVGTTTEVTTTETTTEATTTQDSEMTTEDVEATSEDSATSEDPATSEDDPSGQAGNQPTTPSTETTETTEDEYAQFVKNTNEYDAYALPAGIVEILPYAACGTNIKQSVQIPNTVEYIGDYAFAQSGNFLYVHFEEESNVWYIGRYAFANNQNLDIVLPKSVTTLTPYCMTGIANRTPYIAGTSVTELPAKCFVGCQNLHTIIMPESLERIEDFAFEGDQNINTVVFTGDKLEGLGAGTFQGCTNLHVIDIPEGVKTIEEGTFSGCQNLNEVGLPESLEKIEGEAFAGCQNIHEMVIPEGVTEIAPDSFKDANTQGIDTSKNPLAQEMIPNSNSGTQSTEAPTTEAPATTQAPTTQAPTTQAPATTEALPAVGTKKTIKGVKYQVTGSEPGKMTVKVTGPKKKSVTKVTIPATVEIEGVTYTVGAIAKKAFKGCKKLKSVTIGKNVWYIGDNAFYGCKKLKSITIKSKKLTKVGKNAIKGINKKAKIKVPKAKLKKYKKLFNKKTGFKKSMKIKK